MQTLPTISILNPADYNHYKSFFADCIEYSIDANLRRFNPPSNYEKDIFYEWLGTDRIYICNRNSKNIGFIVFETKDTSQGRTHQVSFYIHPKVCKLASISLARSAAVLAYCELATLNDSQVITTTLHNLVYSVYSQYYTVKAIKSGDYYVINSETKEDTLQRIINSFEHEDLKSYFELFNIKL